MLRSGWLIAFLVAAPVAAQQPDPEKVEIDIDGVRELIYMVTGGGGNMAISVGVDGVLLVDTEFTSLVPKLQEAIAGITAKPVRFVINSHWHPDHTGANATLAKGAILIAHENVRKRLAAGAPSMPGGPVAAAANEALPLLTFDESLTLHFNDEDIRAVHYGSGHTDGDSVVFFTKSNVVYMGDIFVYGLPFVDVASGGSLRGLIESLEKAMAEVPDDVSIIPGHGPPTGHGHIYKKADVRAYAAMLRDCVSLVDAARKRGRSLAQMKAQNVLTKYAASAHGAVTLPGFIELIYNERQREAPSGKR